MAPFSSEQRRHQGRLYLLVLLCLVLVMGTPRIAVEGPFFTAGSLIHRDGSAPVPQDDPNAAPVDAAFRAAVTFLPRGAVCVITRDSWHRDYFRASYLLMPRKIWPVAPLLTAWPPSQATIADAMRTHAATCLLAPSGVPIPAGWHPVHPGAYTTYIQASAR